jgi:tRNA(Ile)-lysidine synthase
MRMEPAVAVLRQAVRESLAGIDAGDLVLVAVSGGADSLALAAATAAEASRLGLRAGAVTVDHGLQDGSDDRAAAVVTTARDLGLDPAEAVSVRVDPATPGGLEAAAREARYEALDKVAEARGAVAVLLGHTLDDQAETVLLGLARGSGGRSLSGMPARRGRYLRPLLGVRRETTRGACTAWGLDPWDDPHNTDPEFTRVRVRRDVLPVLEAALGPGVPEALARTAAMLRSDADALDEWAESVHDRDAVAVLAELPAAVRTRVLRQEAIAAGVPAGALSADHVFAIDRLVTDWHGQGPVSLPGGLVAQRSCDRLSFR